MVFLQRVLGVLLVANIFGGGLVSSTRWGDFYWVYPLLGLTILLGLLGRGRTLLPPWPFLGFMALALAWGAFCIGQGRLGLLPFLKQWVGIALNAWAYWVAGTREPGAWRRLFRVYLVLAAGVSLLGLVQFVAYYAGWPAAYDFSGWIPKFKVAVTHTRFLWLFRVNSVMPEPTHLAMALFPAFLAGMHNLFLPRAKRFLSFWLCLPPILATLLSFSLIGYLGVLMVLGLVLLRRTGKRRFLLAVLGLCLLGLGFYAVVPGFRARINDMGAVFSGRKPLDRINVSSRALLSNAAIAWLSVQNDLLLGRGLGAYPQVWEAYRHDLVSRHNTFAILLNQKDGNALMLRSLVELGVLGWAFWLWFLVGGYPRGPLDEWTWVVVHGALGLFALRWIREGHYFLNGLFFFVWLYYDAGGVWGRAPRPVSEDPQT